jgi:hypothetical protein
MGNFFLSQNWNGGISAGWRRRMRWWRGCLLPHPALYLRRWATSAEGDLRANDPSPLITDDSSSPAGDMRQMRIDANHRNCVSFVTKAIVLIRCLGDEQECQMSPWQAGIEAPAPPVGTALR